MNKQPPKTGLQFSQEHEDQVRAIFKARRRKNQIFNSVCKAFPQQFFNNKPVYINADRKGKRQ